MCKAWCVASDHVQLCISLHCSARSAQCPVQSAQCTVHMSWPPYLQCYDLLHMARWAAGLAITRGDYRGSARIEQVRY